MACVHAGGNSAILLIRRHQLSLKGLPKTADGLYKMEDVAKKFEDARAAYEALPM